MGPVRSSVIIASPKPHRIIIHTMANPTMLAVVFKGPRSIAVETRPVPEIQQPTDIILKVAYSALCGRWVTYILVSQLLLE